MTESLEDAIAETKTLVSGLIRKPKMTEKLLARPPFRFLHDTIMAINAKTQFVDALIGEEERDSANIKDSKQGKLDFLRKVIAFAGICNGEAIDVREAKIVAGAEPINTNALLQALAKAAMDESIDYAAAAGLALDGVPPGRVPRRGMSSATPSESKASNREQEQEQAARASTRKADSEEEKQDVDDGAKETKAPEPSRASRSSRPAEETKAAEQPAASAGSGSGVFAEVDGDVETTMRLYDGLVRKPKLTAKLLGRPPFRFLHDVMTGLRGATGVLEGLFQDEELDSKQCTSKEAKLGYLEKLIRFTEICSGAPVEARASRIVAGQEADKTNMLMQMLAIVARNPAACATSPAQAVQQVLGNDGGNAAEDQDATRTGYPPATEQVQLKGGSDDEGDHGHDSRRRSSRGQSDELARKSSSSSASGRRARGSRAEGASHADDGETKAADAEEDEENDAGAEAKEDVDKHVDRKKLARPQTARKRPPKIRERTAGALEKPPSRGQGAPVGVMREGEEDSDEDEMDEMNGAAGAAIDRQRNDENADPDHGQRLKSKLVRDILDDEQKQEAADAGQPESHDETKKSDERPASRGITMGKIGRGLHKSGKGKPAGAVDVDKIRDAIQLVCQSTNPLGKCMDFVHEDLSAMSKELDKWRSEYRKCCDAMEDEKRITSETLLPLRGKLTEVDENIRDKHARIATLKASIAKNDQRIAELLRDMVLH
ncbi:TRAF3-interacting protein 1 [Hondaea fermentalgiana]|uniref:TRAF3-interacting protein 1 n=1 Tax=Hondaea fermentalgiana TaxID=2315210 RepID=A0A2R5GL91_9STRA|nr:TRAF3-interacting protein 1 [Hondaea fermentalgiana]|eukprot:GBG31640.1 TRAF3-interacting protein 1 [Hondaea fermentalgiana]